jgi:hypothetical protein
LGWRNSILNTGAEAANFRTSPRPAGVTLIAVICLLMCGLYLAFALLTWRELVPLASGAFLIGAGLEIYGPLMFLIFAFLFARAGFGLLRLSRWSRYLVILLAGLGIYLTTPTLSSAVAEFRLPALIRDGFQVVVRVAIIWYMLQEPVREAFA